MPFMPGVEFESTRPYLRLAECMGAMLHALARVPVRRVAVEYRGDEVVGLVKADRGTAQRTVNADFGRQGELHQRPGAGI